MPGFNINKHTFSLEGEDSEFLNFEKNIISWVSWLHVFECRVFLFQTYGRKLSLCPWEEGVGSRWKICSSLEEMKQQIFSLHGDSHPRRIPDQQNDLQNLCKKSW